MENPATWNDDVKAIVRVFDEHNADCEQGIIGGSIYVALEEKIVAPLKQKLADIAQDNEELNASFDLRWKADMRAIERWRKAHPGNNLIMLIMPDHADLVVWLMEELDKSKNRH